MRRVVYQYKENGITKRTESYKLAKEKCGNAVEAVLVDIDAEPAQVSPKRREMLETLGFVANITGRAWRGYI